MGSSAPPCGNGSISNVGIGVILGFDSIVEGLHVGPFFADAISAHGIVKGNIVSGGDRGFGIAASGIVTGNTVEVPNRGGPGIAATGTVTGNVVTGGGPFSDGIAIGQGSTVIGNTVTGARVGLSVSCPSNVTNNTAVNNGTNLVLNGDGCNNTNNVAP
jgi:hypothetical protein